MPGPNPRIVPPARPTTRSRRHERTPRAPDHHGLAAAVAVGVTIHAVLGATFAGGALAYLAAGETALRTDAPR